MTENVFLFPGQLSEGVGMGVRLLERSPSARETIEEASEAAGMDLRRLMVHGPEEDLRSDENAPIAVLSLSVAWHRALLAAGREPGFLLGVSMGLYSAAVAAGAARLGEGIALLREVDRAGRELFRGRRHGMALVVGLRPDSVMASLADLMRSGRIEISNVNSAAQVVLAGVSEALDEAVGRLAGRALRSERLPMSRPYHTAFMEPVARKVALLCESLPVRDPLWPIVYHHDGRLVRRGEELRRLLSRQLCERCDFPRAILSLPRRPDRLFIEVGPGAVLARLLRWINRDAEAVAVEDPAARERVESLLGMKRVEQKADSRIAGQSS